MSAHLLIARSQLQLHNDEQRCRSDEEWIAPKKGVFRIAVQATAALGVKVRRRLGLSINQVRATTNAGHQTPPARPQVRN